MPSSLRAVVIVVITLVWAANFAAPIFVDGYKPNPELNIAFMAILGIIAGGAKKPPPSDDDGGSGDE